MSDGTEIFLYIIIFKWGQVIQHRFPMEDWAACKAAVQTISAELSDGAENEAGIAGYCANDKNERYYSATWWTDERKGSNN